MNEHAIFLAALEIADAGQRSAYLDKACADDPLLRRQVDSLLAAHERTGEFLDVPALKQMRGDAGDSGSEFTLAHHPGQEQLERPRRSSNSFAAPSR